VEDKHLKVIADVLTEILAVMKRNEPSAHAVTFDPKRVKRVKDMRHPSESYRPNNQELEHVMQTQLEPMLK
jgi:hypothetical protein